MSQLKLKQISNPSIGDSGTFILYDGNKLSWSNQTLSGVLLPSGNISERPENIQNGVLRYNSETSSIELYENQSWNNVLKTSQSFSGNEGSYIKVKSDASGVEFVQAPLSNVISYRFKVIFDGTNPATSNTFDEIPSGWSLTLATTDDVIVEHNLNKVPIGAMYFGMFPSTGQYRSRTIGTASSEIQYNLSNLNSCTVTNVTSNTSGSMSGSHCYVQLWFTV